MKRAERSGIGVAGGLAIAGGACAVVGLLIGSSNGSSEDDLVDVAGGCMNAIIGLSIAAVGAALLLAALIVALVNA